VSQLGGGLRADKPFLGVRGAVCWDENRPRRAFGAEVGSYHSRAVNSIRVYICSLVFLYNYWGVSAVVIITGVSLFGTAGFIFCDCLVRKNRVFCGLFFPSPPHGATLPDLSEVPIVALGAGCETPPKDRRFLTVQPIPALG
jgi:hypothetical protein